MTDNIFSILPTILIIEKGNKVALSFNWLGAHFDLIFKVR